MFNFWPFNILRKRRETELLSTELQPTEPWGSDASTTALRNHLRETMTEREAYRTLPKPTRPAPPMPSVKPAKLSGVNTAAAYSAYGTDKTANIHVKSALKPNFDPNADPYLWSTECTQRVTDPSSGEGGVFSGAGGAGGCSSDSSSQSSD
jgi:hypothetical protein